MNGEQGGTNDQSLVPKEIQLPLERMQTRKGMGEIDQEDKIIPRLRIGQGLSPEVEQGIIKPGELFNSISKQSYGTSIIVVPVLWFKTRIYWADRADGGDILCRANDAVNGQVYGECANCQFAKWTTEEKKSDAPKCTAIINIISLINKIPVALSFMKTSYTTGKQLINLFNYKRVDIFNFQYELYTERTENDLGVFYVLKFRDQNTAVSDDVYQMGSAVFGDFKDFKDRVEEVNAGEQG